MNLVIVNRLGTVHRVLLGAQGCNAVRQATKRREVTPLQCVVYKLASCGACWPQEAAYRTHLREALR